MIGLPLFREAHAIGVVHKGDDDKRLEFLDKALSE